MINFMGKWSELLVCSCQGNFIKKEDSHSDHDPDSLVDFRIEEHPCYPIFANNQYHVGIK